MTIEEENARKRIQIYFPDLTEEKITEFIAIVKRHAVAMAEPWIEMLQQTIDVIISCEARKAIHSLGVDQEMRKTIDFMFNDSLSLRSSSQSSRNDNRNDGTFDDGASTR